ncbi:MAG: BlaI/MecI/CopY family transcriptional regulator [Planctomycetes bacterium]|nr:BlaI/MecI/CopY family transcriptional regulator [Planctomycetota bacterium]
MAPDSEALGDLQLRVMDVVWDLGSATVAEAHESLTADRGIAYTTVLSTLRNLEKRGYLRHTVEGKAHRFHPTVTREDHRSASVSRLVSNLFAGDPERLMCHLLGQGEVDAAQLERIRALLEEFEEER